MDAALLASCGAVGTALGLALIEVREHGHRRGWQTMELHFGRDVTPEAVVALLDRVAGLHRFSVIGLDIVADHDGIRHYLHGERATIDALRGSLRALIPSVRLETADDPAVGQNVVGARVIRLRGRLSPNPPIGRRIVGR